MRDPVIILAPPRSFTSVICAMLGQHPQMYGLPEVNLFMAETMRERAGAIATQRKWSNHGLLRVVAQLFGGEQTVKTVAIAKRWLEIRADCTCVSVFREIAEKVSPRMLVEKSPRTITRVEYLQRLKRSFPKTKFLHLSRHPRTQGESVLNIGGGVTAVHMGGLDYSTDPPTIDPQKAWYSLNMNIITFLDGLPEEQKLRLRGEDVLAEPDKYLRQIAEWLGLRTDEEAITAMKHPEESPYAGFGPVTARLGNDPNFLREPALRPYAPRQAPMLDGPLSWREDGLGLSPEVKELAREFGYK